MRTFKTWSKAITGLTMILLGGMVPSALILPNVQFPPQIINLPSSWQIPALLACSLVCGPTSAVISATSYLTIGLFFLPVFHGGGSIGYLLTPEFGYLAGFIPAAGISGIVSRSKAKNQLMLLTFSASLGVITINMFGCINLFLGSVSSRWNDSLFNLFFNHTLALLPTQLIMCPAIAILAIFLKKILIIK